MNLHVCKYSVSSTSIFGDKAIHLHSLCRRDCACVSLMCLCVSISVTFTGHRVADPGNVPDLVALAMAKLIWGVVVPLNPVYPLQVDTVLR